MRYATIRHNGSEKLAVVLDGAVLPVPALAVWAQEQLPTTLSNLIAAGDAKVRDAFGDWAKHEGEVGAIPDSQARYCPPYGSPGKIWGIGLNYRDHAADLDEGVPPEPASFMRPNTTIIGPGDQIVLPSASQRITAEAELGIVLGKKFRDIDEADVKDVIFGFVPILDMTAEDILRRNPRFLTRAKSFDTFFSFGPWIVTPDEMSEIDALDVATVLNGVPARRNIVANMTYSPHFLVAFHSQQMTWNPGDILSTGTPGAVEIRHGDRVACRITGFGDLSNPVIRLEAERSG